MTPTRFRRWVPLLALFLLHALPFATRPALIGGDEPHYALMAHSLAVDGNVDLEPNYREVEAGSAAAGRKFQGRSLERHLVPHGDERQFSHPLGLPALAAPLIGLLQVASPGAPPDLLLGLLGLSLSFAALLASARLLEPLAGSRGEARLLVFALYFATPLWYYSRLFFTEAYSWSLTVLAVFLMTRRRWGAASLLLGSTFLIKETNLLVILPILLGVWRVVGLRRAFLMGLGPLAAGGVWILKNLLIYGEPVVTFQAFRIGDPLAGAIGLLVDPRHGLLPFAPVLALAALCLGAHRGALRPVSAAAWLGAISVYLLTALWIDWTGGSCYGPRLLVPAIPLLAVPLAGAWGRLRNRRTGRAVFIALAGLGFAVQVSAALDPFAAFWSIHVGDLVTAHPVRFTAALAVGLMVGLFLAAQPASDSA